MYNKEIPNLLKIIFYIGHIKNISKQKKQSPKSMKTKFKLIVTSIVFIGLINACKKEGPQGPAGENGTNGTNGTVDSLEPGGIKGTIMVYDQKGVLLSDASGVIVSLAGTNITTTTATNGKYTLTNIPIGTYKMKITKKGYDYVTQQTFITGNGTVIIPLQKLYELSSETIDSLLFSNYNTGTSSYEFKITLKNKSYSGPLTVTMPYSRTAGINACDTTKPMQYEFDDLTQVTSFKNGIGKLSISKANFDKFPGTTVYMKAFITNGQNKPMDYDTGLLYYTNFTKPSPEINFKTL